MPKYVGAESSNSSKFLHPAGSFAAVLIDVIDLGLVKSVWEGETKMQYKIVLRFWAGEYNEEKQPLFPSQRFTRSLHENSALRPFLVAWRGREFTDAELAKFDLDSLMHQQAYITVVHKKHGEKTYANVVSAAKLPKGAEHIMPLADYVRVENRPPKEPQHASTAPGPSTPTPFDPDEEDLPF